MLCTDYQLHDQSNGLHSDIDHWSVDLNEHKLPAKDIEICGLSEHAILPSSLTGTVSMASISCCTIMLCHYAMPLCMH